MNLAKNRPMQFLALLQAIPRGEFTTRDAYPLGAQLGFSPHKVRQSLSVLEKADKLVRMRQGVYLTMEEYVRQGYGLPED